MQHKIKCTEGEKLKDESDRFKKKFDQLFEPIQEKVEQIQLAQELSALNVQLEKEKLTMIDESTRIKYIDLRGKTFTMAEKELKEKKTTTNKVEIVM